MILYRGSSPDDYRTIFSLSLFPAKAMKESSAQAKQLSYLTHHTLETQPFSGAEQLNFKGQAQQPLGKKGDEPYVNQMGGRDQVQGGIIASLTRTQAKGKVPEEQKSQRTSSATSVRYEIERYGFIPAVKPLIRLGRLKALSLGSTSLVERVNGFGSERTERSIRLHQCG